MCFLVIVCRVNDAQSRPRREYTPKPRPSYDYGELENSNGGYSPAETSPPAYSSGKLTFVYFVRAVWVAYSQGGMCAISFLRLMCLSLCDIKQSQHNIQLHPSKEPPSRAEGVSETDEDTVSLTQN